jgi:hypothetical protein
MNMNIIGIESGAGLSLLIECPTLPLPLSSTRQTSLVKTVPVNLWLSEGQMPNTFKLDILAR